MTSPAGQPSDADDAEAAEARALATPGAIRDRAEALYRLCARGALAHFSVDESALPALTARVIAVTRARYPNLPRLPDLRAIPDHTRFRHFGVGGIDRVAALDACLEARLGALPAEQRRRERLRAKLELAITSVLLDAGAGERWSYQEAGGETYARSEGLAVASYHLFADGVFSDDPAGAPHRADAAALARFGDDALARGFQVSADNPLVGVAGRAAILRRLGQVVARRSDVFGEPAAAPEGGDRASNRLGNRLGNLGVYLTARARGGELPAADVLGVVLDALGDIWPGREICAGKNLGDVWRHPAVGRVPFHKLSQWLTYSLCEPLQESGVRIVGIDQLTGLAEYRNGGLFVDGGVLIPKHPEVLAGTHAVSSELVVEWRALTIALLDRTAVEMRRQLGFTPEELPLPKVLEGGTWAAGRALARERRADGAPPIRVQSDGTVF